MANATRKEDFWIPNGAAHGVFKQSDHLWERSKVAQLEDTFTPPSHLALKRQQGSKRDKEVWAPSAKQQKSFGALQHRALQHLVYPRTQADSLSTATSASSPQTHR